MRVIVTGATGRIGAPLVRRLVERSHSALAILRPGTSRRERIAGLPINTKEVDLGDYEQLHLLVREVDGVIHLGADMTGDPWGQFTITLGSTVALLEGCRLYNPSLKRFVFASSIVVYEQVAHYRPGRPIGEEEAGWWVTSPYTASKGSAEVFCYTYARCFGVPTVILRLPAVKAEDELLTAGPGSSLYIQGRLKKYQDGPSSVEEQKAKNALQKAWEEGKRLVVPLNPDGTPHQRHFGQVEDIVEGFILALEKEDVPPGIAINIMSKPFNYREAVQQLADLSGDAYAEIVIPPPYFYEFDLTRAQKILGYTPQYDARAMVRSAWEAKLRRLQS